MTVHLVKWKNGLAIRIPRSVAEQANLKAGDSVDVEVVAEGRLQLRHAGKIPRLVNLVAQITPENRYAEISSGVALGNEKIEW